MIDLVQQKNQLIGSLRAIKALSKKEQARLLVLSDIHGESKTFFNILKTYGPTCDALIICGDSASDIVSLLNDAHKNKELKAAIPPVFCFVQGNCDTDAYPVKFSVKKLEFPARQKIAAASQNILIVHGHKEGVNFGLDNLAYEAKKEDCSIVCFGHTHLTNNTINSEVKLINPGSCSCPRGGLPKSFCIITVEKTFSDAAFIKIENALSENPSYKIYNGF